MSKRGQAFGSKGSIVIYKAKGGKTALEVKLEKDTVWLTQKQMAELFDKGIPTINEHIKNIFKEGELMENSVIRNFRITAADGKTYDTQFYNLDVIISVGYRVKSQGGTQFRIWTTKVLKDYLIRGYALNQNRIIEQHQVRIRELQQAIAFMGSKIGHPKLNEQGQELLKILHDYTDTMTLLYEYDKNIVSLHKKQKPSFILTYEDCRDFIKETRKKLSEKGEATPLFGQEIDHKFKSISGTLYQTFDGKDLYPSLEEKAAHLLYLTIKDHPFADGNKRIGSLLFVYFLNHNNALWKKAGERKINDNTLVVLALLIATSNPKEKDVMIKIITNLLR